MDHVGLVGIPLLDPYHIKHTKGVVMELTNKMKQDIKTMFNEYVMEYSKLMPKEQAIQFAMHKTRQNTMIMLKTYK